MKRKSAIFMSIVLAAAQLFACGDISVQDENTLLDDTETTAIENEASLPDIKWDGREFRVLGCENQSYTQFNNFEIYAESETGEPVNDAIFKRNSRIQEKYDVKITQTLVGVPQKELKNAVLSQEDLYDLAFIGIGDIGTLAADGYLYDLNTVDYIDFSRDYWNEDVNESLTIGSSLYFTSSDFSLRDKNRVYILCYNRDMLENYQLDSIVDKVRDGTWTADAMKEYTKAVTVDLNNDGVMFTEDNYGIGFDSYNGLAALVYGYGVKVVQNNSNGKLEIVMNNERTISGIDKALAIAQDGFYCEDFAGKVDYDHWYVSSNLFFNEQTLFTATFPHVLANLSASCDFDYGICPFPKYDEKQEKYYSLADVKSMLFSIPISSSDPDFSGFMLEALSADSEEVLHNYYEITCKVKYIYDEDSAEMLDTIFDGIVFDLGFIYSDLELYTIYTYIAEKNENIFSSVYASREVSAQTKLEALFEQKD